jgi:hypothetical protein
MHGKTNESWNVVYDPATDQVLTWRSWQVRIYHQCGHWLYIYIKMGRVKRHSPGMLFQL